MSIALRELVIPIRVLTRKEDVLLKAGIRQIFDGKEPCQLATVKRLRA